jgi:riboflavin transporter FmnP
MRIATKTLAGIIVLAALVVVFDYTLKYSGFKIPFPWLPFLKFDFTGVPIVLSLLLFGLVPGAFTSTVAALAILARSADLVGSSMKGLAEFSTVLGIFIGIRLTNKFRLLVAFIFGIATRVLVMTVANFALIYFGVMKISFVLLPLIGVFNVIQGSISILGGCLIYAAIRKRIPPLTENAAVKLETGPNS